MATKMTQAQIISEITHAGVSLYKERSGFPLNQAQRNLEGRTHYVDDAALASFQSKIVGAYVLDEGMIFGIIESLEHPTLGKIFRPVFFDLFGNVVAKLEAEDSVDTFRKANTKFWEMSEELDPVDLTLKGVKTKQQALQDEIDKLDTLQKALR